MPYQHPLTSAGLSELSILLSSDQGIYISSSILSAALICLQHEVILGCKGGGGRWSEHIQKHEEMMIKMKALGRNFFTEHLHSRRHDSNRNNKIVREELEHLFVDTVVPHFSFCTLFDIHSCLPAYNAFYKFNYLPKPLTIAVRISRLWNCRVGISEQINSCFRVVIKEYVDTDKEPSTNSTLPARAIRPEIGTGTCHFT